MSGPNSPRPMARGTGKTGSNDALPLAEVQSSDPVKLQKHLTLLRQEYLKLQSKMLEMEKALAIATAAANQTARDNYVARILKKVEELFDKDTFSDVAVKVGGRVIRAHKFVLLARGERWTDGDFNKVTEIELPNLSFEVGWALLRWVYTDRTEIRQDVQFAIELLTASNKYSLIGLKERCEHVLVSCVTVENACNLFEVADTAAASELRRVCATLILNYWHEIPEAKFAAMPAPLLYELFKQITRYPLHMAIKHGREDVVFLFLIEHSTDASRMISERDDAGDVPLHLALVDRHEEVARTLVSHACDVDSPRASDGYTLLHAALDRCDTFSADFLIDNGANVAAASADGSLPMHVATAKNLPAMVTHLLSARAPCNAQDSLGRTALHVAVANDFVDVVAVLLKEAEGLNLNVRDKEGRPAVWLALERKKFGLATTLRNSGCDLRVADATFDSMLHRALRLEMAEAAEFLIDSGVELNLGGAGGQTPLHIACEKGMVSTVTRLLEKGANPNAKDSAGTSVLHTCVHFDRPEALEAVLVDPSKLELNARDGSDESPLTLALAQDKHHLAQRLMEAGADVDSKYAKGLMPLHNRILAGDEKGALFLLRHKASIEAQAPAPLRRVPLQLAVQHKLQRVVEELCKLGAKVDVPDEAGAPPVWAALCAGSEGIATVLVRYKCELNGRDRDGNAMLHQAIVKRNSAAAVFLAKNGADVNAKAGDGRTPLHMAASEGLADVVEALLAKQATVNATDAEQRTALHVAVAAKHDSAVAALLTHPGIDLALRNKEGRTAFGIALETKNEEIAKTMLSKSPAVADHVDANGRNFLHVASEAGDLERVLFLLVIRVDVDARTHDAQNATALILASTRGNETVCRHLIQAGAEVNAADSQRRTALHFASQANHGAIVNLLLENGADVGRADSEGNTPLHLAIERRHVHIVRTLLKEGGTTPIVANAKGHTPLHVLGINGAGPNALAVFEILSQAGCVSDINATDHDGNTALLLAFAAGAEQLCVALVRAKAHVSIPNRNGFSCMDSGNRGRIQKAMLEAVPGELAWLDAKECQNCKAKFTVQKRKHHCRHCARILCNKCSSRQLPIIKFDEMKPVRVCDTCYDVIAAMAGQPPLPPEALRRNDSGEMDDD